VVAVVHDNALVRAYFPNTLVLARQVVAWGDTALALTPANLLRAGAMAEAWDEDADLCHADADADAALSETRR
jgi:zinc/manganese transport system ATP-binding protein